MGERVHPRALVLLAPSWVLRSDTMGRLMALGSAGGITVQMGRGDDRRSSCRIGGPSLPKNARGGSGALPLGRGCNSQWPRWVRLSPSGTSEPSWIAPSTSIAIIAFWGGGGRSGSSEPWPMGAPAAMIVIRADTISLSSLSRPSCHAMTTRCHREWEHTGRV